MTRTDTIRLYVLFRAVFNDYLKGADYGSGEANFFTVITPFSTPVTAFGLNNGNNIIDQYQGITGAYTDTQSAPITLVRVYHRS